MRRLVSVRLLTTAALIGGGSLALGGFASSASAATGVSCTSLAAGINGSGTLSGCNDLPNTGGSGKLVANVAKKTGTITWNKTGTTTSTFNYSSPKTDETETKVCAKGTAEIVVTGVVTGGTGAAIKSIPKGSKISAELCFNSKTNTVTLEPGTVFSIK